MKPCSITLFSPIAIPALACAAMLTLTTLNSRADADLVAWWPLDEVVGETTPDQSGHGYHMDLNNMDASNIVPGKLGGAMEFDGSTAMLTHVAEDGEDLPISQHPSYSIALWVKGAYNGQVGGGDRRVFSEGSDLNSDPLLNIGTHNGAADATVDIYLRNAGSPGHQHSFSEAFDDGWHHIVMVRDGDADEVLLYIDGELDEMFWTFQDPFSPDITNNTSIGGILRASPSHWFTGQIDDVAVFKSALTIDEIGKLMSGELLSGENPDKDGDGILDSWEALYGVDDPAADGDEDGLSNLDEFKNRTNPTKADTDEDGLKDGVETGTGEFVDGGNTGTDPLEADTDGDGIPDGVESNSGVFVSAADPGTSPLSKDTDKDGFSDKTEIDSGANPVDAASFPDESALLVAFWPLDEVIGETTPDISGNGYDMTLNNMDTGNLVEGKVGNALEFDGSQSMLTRIHEDDQDLPITQHESFSVALWVKGAYDDQVGGGDMRVFSVGANTGDNDPLFNIGTHNGGADGTVDLFLRNGGSPNHEHSVLEAFDGEWHHIAYVQNGEEISLYVDGVLDEQVWTFWDTYKPGVTNDTSIGGILRASPSHWFTGLIDEVGLWKSAISAATVQALVEGNSPGGSQPIFQITNVVHGDGELTFSWASKAGASYAIDNSFDLQTWLEIEDGVEGEADQTSFTIPEPGSEIYVRIRQQQ